MRKASLPHAAHFSRSALQHLSFFLAEKLGNQFAAHYQAVLERRYWGATLKRDDGLALYGVRRPVVVGLYGKEVEDPERVPPSVLVFDEDLIAGFHLVQFVE